VQGRVEARHTVPVSVSIAGEVDSFSADVGQDVFEGQILGRIANEGLQTGRDNAQRIVQSAEAKLGTLETAISAARLEAARAHTESVRAADDLNRASKEYDRQKMLHKAGATPRNTYERSEKDYEAARSETEGSADIARRADERVEQAVKEYDNTRKTLEDKRKELEEVQTALAATEVHAPVGGVIVARQGEIGKTLTQQEASALFLIATDISALQAVFPVDPAMKVGDTVMLTFGDASTEPLRAIIRQIKNGEATAEFTSANPAIRPGPCTMHVGFIPVGPPV
jgi:multidrug resistance efflux pump